MINKNKRFIRCCRCECAFWRYGGRQKYCGKCQDVIRREIVKKSVKKNSKGNYIVYKHVSPGGKIYFGITSQEPEIRWNHGFGYSSNLHFTNAINKYGWKNFEHVILYENLNLNEAASIEKKLIKEYNTNDPNKGYNITPGGEGRKYDLVDEYGCVHITIEDKRKKVLSLINSNRMVNKIYQPISEEYLNLIKKAYLENTYFIDCIITLFVYYEFMSDMNFLLEDYFVEIKEDKFHFCKRVKSCIIKLINNKYFLNFFEWRNYNGIYYYKIKNVNTNREVNYNNKNYRYFFHDFPSRHSLLILANNTIENSSLNL